MINLLDVKIRHTKDGTPVLSKAEIERHAEDYLARYEHDTRMYDLHTPMATPIEEIVEDYCRIRLLYKDFWDESTLGATAFADGVIEVRQDGRYSQYAAHAGEMIISSKLSDDETKEGRYRYTLGHELGHVSYHREKYEERCDSSLSFDFGEISNSTTKKTMTACRGENIEMAWDTCTNDWEEWQADYFSACILMPRVSVGVFIEPYLCKWFDAYSSGGTNRLQDFSLSTEIDYPLSRLPMGQQMSIVDDFMKTYSVSRQAARIRLKVLGLMRS